MDRHTYTQRTRDMETQADRLRKAKQGKKGKEEKNTKKRIISLISKGFIF